MAMTLFEYRQWLKKMKKGHREAGIRGVQSAALRLVQRIQTEIIPSVTPQPVDRGLFRAGWRFTFMPDGALILNVEPHAPFIEFGVRSANVKIGRKMIAALTEWVVRKRLAAPGKDAVSAAWAIAKAAKRKGIFGTGLRILERAKAQAPDLIREEVSREIELLKQLIKQAKGGK